MKNILLLASQSLSHRRLLADINIPFVLLDQCADESACDWGLPLPQLVESIAKHKMDQVIMPKGVAGQEAYVLTADTLTQDANGNLLGKPGTKENALAMLKAVSPGARVGTVFCLDRKVYQFDAWQIKDRIITYVEARCVFAVPDHWVDRYLENSIALKASGAITVEGYGQQFFKELSGSYTTIQGLPLTELRQALEKLEFF